MYTVMVAIGVFFGAGALYFWNKKLRQRLVSFQELISREQASVAKFDLQREKLRAQVSRLSGKLSVLEAVYDITKEVSKSFEQEQVIAVFKEKLSQVMNLKDCQIVTAEQAKKFRAQGYQVYSISGKDEVYRSLAISSDEPLDDMLVTLTVYQLTLALRRSRLYRQIEELSIIDGLTGIHSRRYFMQRAHQELARAKQYGLPASFLMVDIDHFKYYNDTFSHMAGDRLLRETAQIIKGGLRQIDMFARWGGEEFCVLLPDTPKNGAVMVAERLRGAVEQARIKAYDESFKITISIGVAQFPDDAEDYESLIEKADQALYKAKDQGRNTVYCYGLKKQ